MIRIHDAGTLREFADRAAIAAHFSLDRLSEETVAGLKAASDAGHPLHATVDPFAAEIHGVRVLLTDTSLEGLRHEYRERCDDI